MKITFEEFYLKNTENTVKRFSNYMGITKKDHPRWQGWSLLSKLDNPNDECKTLNVLVRNFYFIEYLKTL